MSANGMTKDTTGAATGDAAQEANFDGLIGPTHNYGGLSDGNLASAKNAGLVAHPRDAALQGLAKMERMMKAGLWQGILPPHQRPYLPTLREAGFSGSDKEVLSQVWKSDPALAKNVMSASNMWSANAATVSPSFDTTDGKTHFTPANLSTMLHRSLEPEQTQKALERGFPFATVHAALPQQSFFADEGAANHVRLCGTRGGKGVELFVYGRDALSQKSGKFPARQTLQASQAIVRRHGLSEARTIFARQSQIAIDAGAFHNDVVCVGALETLFYHQDAFEHRDRMQADVRDAAKDLFIPQFVEVPRADVPLEDAIKAYLFNSMLVMKPGDRRLTLIAPLETQENAKTFAFCQSLIAGSGPIGHVEYIDVRQSMRNGGGPACLRLRVTLSAAEWAQVNPKMKASPSHLNALRDWVTTHYREDLAPEDLSDPNLMIESFTALDALTTLMGLGSDFYPFQHAP